MTHTDVLQLISSRFIHTILQFSKQYKEIRKSWSNHQKSIIEVSKFFTGIWAMHNHLQHALLFEIDANDTCPFCIHNLMRNQTYTTIMLLIMDVVKLQWNSDGSQNEQPRYALYISLHITKLTFVLHILTTATDARESPLQVCWWNCPKTLSCWLP